MLLRCIEELYRQNATIAFNVQHHFKHLDADLQILTVSSLVEGGMKQAFVMGRVGQATITTLNSGGGSSAQTDLRQYLVSSWLGRELKGAIAEIYFSSQKPLVILRNRRPSQVSIDCIRRRGCLSVADYVHRSDVFQQVIAFDKNGDGTPKPKPAKPYPKDDIVCPHNVQRPSPARLHATKDTHDEHV